MFCADGPVLKIKIKIKIKEIISLSFSKIGLQLKRQRGAEKKNRDVKILPGGEIHRS